MLHRLRKITDGLFRGSAPSPKDVQWLKDKLGIKKIVSLDKKTGEKINRVCKLLDIDHVMMPLDGSKKALLKLLSQDLYHLLINDGPTYIHCHHGKDRTGLVSAMFECKYMGIDPEDAITKAKSLGFGIGVNPQVIKLYEKIIKSCKSLTDENSADIVSHVREYISDNRSGPLDQVLEGSFAPYLSQTKQMPMDAVYNPINDQSPTRENYNDFKSIKEYDKESTVPLVGLYNNDAGVQGFGPTLNPGGFIYD